jgi:hypothetical protein
MEDLVESEMIRLLRMRAEILRISNEPDAGRRLASWLMQRRGYALWKAPPSFWGPSSAPRHPKGHLRPPRVQATPHPLSVASASR